MKKKNANLELLRIISMMMVVMLHTLGKGYSLLEMEYASNINGWIAWLLESFSICAVNVFMLISGYFLINSRFKLSRLIELVCEVVFYSFFGFIAGYILNVPGAREVDIYHLAQYILPVHMEVYWFATAYVVLYLLSPILSKGIKALTKKQFGTTLILLLVYECFIMSICPVKLTVDESGNDPFWYVIMFAIGAYIRLYGLPFKEKTSKKWLLLYFMFALLDFAEGASIRFIAYRFDRFKDSTGLALHYNNIIVLGEALCLFMAFLLAKPLKEKFGKAVCFLSPMAFGVYLCHESPVFRFNWQKWVGVLNITSLPVWEFVLRVFAGVITVYAVCTVIDFVRIKLFGLVGKILAKSRLGKKVSSVDKAFIEE